jgi:hypothetical protein
MGEHEAREKFEMIWCGKEKAIEEYKVKACDVDVLYDMFSSSGWIDLVQP